MITRDALLRRLHTTVDDDVFKETLVRFEGVFTRDCHNSSVSDSIRLLVSMIK